MILQDKKITINEMQSIMSEMEIDLQAYYDVLEQAVMQEIRTAVEQGKTPDELILSVENLFGNADDGTDITEQVIPAVEEIKKAISGLSKITKELKNGKNID